MRPYFIERDWGAQIIKKRRKRFYLKLNASKKLIKDIALNLFTVYTPIEMARRHNVSRRYVDHMRRRLEMMGVRFPKMTWDKRRISRMKLDRKSVV